MCPFNWPVRMRSTLSIAVWGTWRVFSSQVRACLPLLPLDFITHLIPVLCSVLVVGVSPPRTGSPLPLDTRCAAILSEAQCIQYCFGRFRHSVASCIRMASPPIGGLGAPCSRGIFAASSLLYLLAGTKSLLAYPAPPRVCPMASTCFLSLAWTPTCGSLLIMRTGQPCALEVTEPAFRRSALFGSGCDSPEEYICNSAFDLSEAPIGWSFPQGAAVGRGGAVVPRHNPHDCMCRVVCLGSTTRRRQGREANPAT